MTKPLAAASTLMGAAIAGLSLGSAAFAVAISPRFGLESEDTAGMEEMTREI